MDQDQKPPTDPLKSRCSGCGAPLGLRADHCPRCRKEALETDSKACATQLGQELATSWADAPYFRSAEGVSYTPRRQLRGFLSEAQHPLGDAMLHYLFVLALLAEPSQLRRLLHHALDSMPPGSGRLAQTLRHVFRVHSAALAQVSQLKERARLRSIVLTGSETGDDALLRNAYVTWRSTTLNVAR